MTCRKCKLPMEELKGHLFHKQRKWRCAECSAIRMQKPRKPRGRRRAPLPAASV